MQAAEDTARRRPSALRLLLAAPELIPGVLAMGVFVAWSAAEGGFLPTSYYPGGLFLAGLLVAVAVAYRDHLRAISRPAAIALAAFGGYVVWSFLSITWADVKGNAWSGADQSLIYFTIYALFVIPPWRPIAAALVLGLLSLGVCVVGFITLLDANASADPSLFMIGDRFSEPTGYQNANAALFLGALWPALFLGSRREVPWPARAVMLAVAGVLVELALLSQSRGSVIVFPITLVLYFALVAGRVRALIAALPVAIVVALSAGSILHVFDVGSEGGDLAAAFDDAVGAITISAVALLVIGAALGLADRGVEVPAAASRLANRIAAGATAVAAVVGVVIAISIIGNPVSWGSDRWDSFKGGYPDTGFGGSRFGGSLGSNRYDFWRVALDEFTDSPITGIGVDNFGSDYLERRDSDEEPRQAHSLPVSVLSETGIVGTLLFAGFVIAALIAIPRRRLAAIDPFAAGLAGAAIVTFAYFLFHSSGDWLWQFAALAGPAIAALGLGAGLDRRREPAEKRIEGGRLWAIAASVAAVALIAVVSYALPWLSTLQVNSAAAGWRADPDGAFRALDRARNLNFLSADPDLVAGTIAVRLEERDRARTSFTRALDRDPRNWYALLELGALEAIEGNRATAIGHLDEAARLDPGDPLIQLVRRRVRDGRRVSLERIDMALLERVCGRIGRTQSTSYCE